MTKTQPQSPEGVRRDLTFGLVEVQTEQLRVLLRAVYRRELPCPLTAPALTAFGLQDWSESILGTLRGLDAPAVHAVLVAVLAERSAADERVDG